MTPIYKQEQTTVNNILTYCQNYVDPPGFEVKTVNDVIGEEVSATKPFKKGDFLLECKGDLITRVKHARQLEKEYEKESNTMTTRSTDSQEPGQTTSIHTEEVNETVCNISQGRSYKGVFSEMYGTKKGNTMTTRSTDSQEPGQTTSVHTEEVDETVCNISLCRSY
ncbi:hypothetical protein DPMN_179651 [Dreissena polymorpha]|uniref:Uncharacterized protein n=1 Tax=Dreissena polymorpha TaxID=45954 RepID=A0A9D4ED70_DREPO|nr:hypothetical protein DPMN_179651 [Dreissena polymorpha]